MNPSAPIAIAAVNARYSHASHSARCLLAALGPLANRAVLLEEDLDVHPFQLAGAILGCNPAGIAFSVYIWNARIVEDTLRIIRLTAPHLPVILGGPEIIPGDPRWQHPATTCVHGDGETAFAQWAADLFGAPLPHPASPYDFYTDADLAHRTVYVESSRGCPYGCTYCTSCRTGLTCFPVDQLTRDFDRLTQRGIRAFRFLDRSFNANEPHACAVLDYFLQRHPGRHELHLEIIPGNWGPALRERLAAFPPGALHIEVGVQTLDPATARTIGRTIPPEQTIDCLNFLNHAGARVHADLIFGLPGEKLETFAAGFDRLVREAAPPELQVNLLKLLPGTRLRHDAKKFNLVFNPAPPYEVLSTDAMDFTEITTLQRFARCWEFVHNRGRFPDACARLLATPSPFHAFLELSAYIHIREGRLHAIHARRWAEHIADFLGPAPKPPVA